MGLTGEDRRLIDALEDGLPLVARPYAALAHTLGRDEAEVRDGIEGLVARGLARRFGVIVRHRALGYGANAMVVWDVADDCLSEAGRRLAVLDYVTLCYRRRRTKGWPYNLYCMIHGRERRRVAALIEQATRAAGLEDAPRAVLFSRRAFKQRGAHTRAEMRETAA